MGKINSSITRNDVAELAGVSPATVSYVVNNGPRPVAEETRKKVLAAIQELGYRPNAVARNLRRQQTSTLGLIIPDTCNTYFAEVAEGIESVAYENNYTLVFCNSDYSLERELHHVDHLFAERAAGVILIPATSSQESVNRLLGYNIPTVTLDRYVEGENVPSVIAKNFEGGYLATQHLISLGHKRIGCIARPVSLSHTQERVDGYHAALKEADLAIDPVLFAAGGYRMENGRIAMHTLLALEEPPTAVFCYNDIMAIGALRAAHEHGLRIPQDISISGFDDIIESSFTFPALTTVRQPKFDMGRQGMELLLRLIASGSVDEVEKVPPLDVELVVRESTDKAPALNQISKGVLKV